jgi:aminopeptidase N
VIRRTLALATVVSLVAVPSTMAQEYVAGSPGLGDPFFPKAGNGGYNAIHYDLTLDYDQPANVLTGTAVIDAKATQNLRRFNLDLRNFYRVSSVRVNGSPADFVLRDVQELRITPAAPLDAGDAFTVDVGYSGTPRPITDPDKSIEGFVPTDDGAFVVNEPQGSPGWFPVNDSPRDKATYEFKVTVPAGHTVMANGELVSHTSGGGEETWRWRENSPMAPYLTTITNGPFETEFYATDFGLPMYDAVDPDTALSTRIDPDPDPDPDVAWERLAPQGEIIRFFSDLYGDYPFTTGGGIVDWAPNVGYALESQTRANYHRVPSASTVVHEIAHQWFGNAVTLEIWPDIWLNEGFATFSEWIYTERHGGQTAAQAFDELYAIPQSDPSFEDLWFPAPAALEHPRQLFHTPVYDRGAMTLQALREKVGNGQFFQIMRRWYGENKYGGASTEDFIDLSERIARRNLDAFFSVWLYEEGRPESW